MNFFEKYFIYPTTHLTGYNLVNTTVYSIIFVVVAYIVYKFLEYKRVKVDSKFIGSAFPFALFGVLYRLQVDYHKFQPTFYTVTPGCWILPFLPWISTIGLSNEKTYFKNSLIVGSFLLLASSILFTLKISNLTVFLLYVVLVGLIIESLLIENFYLLAFIGEYTDAISSYIGVKLGMFEEHVASRLLISISPELYLVSKLIVTACVLVAIYRINIPIELKKYLCSVIFILGFGPGSRNWLLLAR